MSSPSQPPAGSPLAWLLLTNALFWGGLFGGEALLSELASRRQESPTANPGALPNGKLAELLQPNPWRQAGPPARGQATPAVPTTLLPGSPAPGVPRFQPQFQPRFQPQFATAASSKAGLSPLARQLQGADALGGEITLASLGEPRMLPAARAERLNWQRSGNPLSPLPLHWQNRLRQETAGGPPIQRADLVRVPVAQLQQRELDVLATQLSDNQAQLQAVGAQQAQLAGSFARNPGLIRQFDGIQQRLRVAKDNLAGYLQARENFRLEVAQRTVPWQVIDPPEFGATPVEPSLTRNLL